MRASADQCLGHAARLPTAGTPASTAARIGGRAESVKRHIPHPPPNAPPYEYPRCGRKYSVAATIATLAAPGRPQSSQTAPPAPLQSQAYNVHGSAYLGTNLWAACWRPTQSRSVSHRYPLSHEAKKPSHWGATRGCNQPPHGRRSACIGWRLMPNVMPSPCMQARLWRRKGDRQRQSPCPT